MTDGGEVQEARSALRSAGLRVTAGRIAVLGVLRSMPHSDAEAIHRAASREAALTLQAVYQMLPSLVEAGLVRRIEPAGSAARYERRTGDNHHHLVCEGCGRIEDVDCVVGEAPCLEPGDDAGFAVREAEVTFWGTCADCLERALPAAPHHLTAAPDIRSQHTQYDAEGAP